MNDSPLSFTEKTKLIFKCDPIKIRMCFIECASRLPEPVQKITLLFNVTDQTKDNSNGENKY